MTMSTYTLLYAVEYMSKSVNSFWGLTTIIESLSPNNSNNSYGPIIINKWCIISHKSPWSQPFKEWLPGAHWFLKTKSFPFSHICNRQRSQRRALSRLFIFARDRRSQSCAWSLFLAKTNMKEACFRISQSSSLPQSCAKEKSSGVEIGVSPENLHMRRQQDNSNKT